MDAHNPLILSEGVCRQQGIISYHPSVELQQPATKQQTFSKVPTVRMRLVHSVRLPPQQMTTVTVQVENRILAGPVVMEPTRLFNESEGDGVQFGDSLVVVSEMGVLEFSWLIKPVTQGSWRKALGLVVLVKPLVLPPLLRMIPRPQRWMSLLE